jgi:hypothetical protein
MKEFNSVGLARRVLLPILGAWMFAAIALPVQAQPLVDSLKALQQRNDKMYRELKSADDQGASYQFTNVTAWKITDDDLKHQIETVFRASAAGEKRLKDIDVDRIYVFAAPYGAERFEPFHVLFIGKRIAAVDTNNTGDILFGGGKRKNSGGDQYIAFKDKDVVRLMLRQPVLAENINSVQGEIFEMPGDILPSGVQLIKSSAQRYIFHQMFDGFYSKRQIIDEQNRAIGLPTSDEAFGTADTSTAVNPDQIPTNPEASTALPDNVFAARAFKYGKTIDLSLNHLLVNASKNTAIELQLGNPEVGLPFWSSGEGRLSLVLKNQIGSESNFKLGFDFPANLGRDDAGIWKARRLSGFFGGSIDAYFAGIDFFSAFNMPVAFNFTILPAGGSNSSIIYGGGATFTTSADGQPFLIPAGRTFYRTAVIGQLYIPIIVQLDPANFLQFSAGIGIHTVFQSWIPDGNDVKKLANNGHPIDGNFQDKIQDLARVSTPVTPHVGLEFVNHRSSKFGLNMYYDHLFTFGGWIELVEDHLRIETSYTAPLVRDAKPYEPPYFFQITPRIYF